MRYFKYKEIKYVKYKGEEKQTVLTKIVNKISLFFVDYSDYDKKLDDVYEWLVEYDDDKKYVQREIALDINAMPLIKMKFKKKYTYLYYNRLQFGDFDKLWMFELINKKEFKRKWKELDSIQFSETKSIQINGTY